MHVHMQDPPAPGQEPGQPPDEAVRDAAPGQVPGQPTNESEPTQDAAPGQVPGQWPDEPMSDPAPGQVPSQPPDSPVLDSAPGQVFGQPLDESEPKQDAAPGQVPGQTPDEPMSDPAPGQVPSQPPDDPVPDSAPVQVPGQPADESEPKRDSVHRQEPGQLPSESEPKQDTALRQDPGQRLDDPMQERAPGQAPSQLPDDPIRPAGQQITRTTSQKPESANTHQAQVYVQNLTREVRGQEDIQAKYADLARLGLDMLAIQKLERKAEKLAPSDSLKCLLSCIDVGRKKTAGAGNSNMIVVLGNTRVGKSTTINFLCGCEMVTKNPSELGIISPEPEVVAVKGRSEGGPKDSVTGIGHSMESMTFIPSLVQARRSNQELVTICDCPGFADNRGFEINISNAVNTCNTLHRAESVRILLLVDLATLTNGAVSNVAFEGLVGLFGDLAKAEHHVGSIYIGVTKVGGRHTVTVTDLRNFILAEERCHALLKKCAERNLGIIDPLVQHPEALSAASLLEALVSMPPVADHKTAIQTSLNAEDREAIGETAAPFLDEITQGISEDSYSAVANKLQNLSNLQVLGHQKVDDVLQQAEERVRQALQKKKMQISAILLREDFTEPQQKAAALKRLLFEKLNGAKILDEYFCLKDETPVADAVTECMQQIKAHETEVVQKRDDLLNQGAELALSAFEAQVHKDDSTSGDVFKELDRERSRQSFQLVRVQNSQIPAPPSSLLPSLAALGEISTKLKTEIERRPESYCLVTEVHQLEDMRSKMSERFLEHLDTGVRLTMQKSYDLALSQMQYSFSDVVEKHNAAILESNGQFDFPRDFPKIQDWFGMDIVGPLARVTDWAATTCTAEQNDAVKRKLLDKLEELCKRAQDHHQVAESEQAVRFIGDHSIVPRDLATHSVKLQEKLQFLAEAGKEEVVREQQERLQKKLDTYCSKTELQRMFADSSFQQLRVMLLDAKTIRDNISMLRVPSDDLTSTFKALLLEERDLAEAQMTDRKTWDNASVQKFSNILKIFSVQGLEDEFFAEYAATQGPAQGIPWGTTDTKIVEDACTAMLARANEAKFEEVVRLLVKYRDITNLLVEGHKDGGVFRDAFKAGVDGLANANDPPYVAHGVGELLHALIRQHSTSNSIRTLAQEIIESFTFFSTALVARFNEIAGGVSFDQAVTQVKDLGGQPVLQSRGEDNLKECFRWVKAAYDHLMGEVLKPGARTKEHQQKVIGDIQKNCAKLANEIGRTKDFSVNPTRENVSTLIGNIFAMWSLAKSGEAYVEGNKNKMVQPHDPQILVVLHLLGIGLEGPVRNHIAQVGTGEGKSVCLGTLGAFFQLLGFEVNIVCYSPFLSERDQRNFQPLFDKLGVAPVYSCIGSLCEQVQLSDDLDLRKHAENVLNGVVSPATSPTSPQHEHRILIIDEVDVFFGEDFYGNFYTPCHILPEIEGVRLLRYVWDHRREDLTVEAVASSQEAHELQQRFPGMTVPLLKNIIEQMLRDIEFFRNDTPSHEFKVGRDEYGRQRVGYLDEVTGVVNYQLTVGYQTAFAFAHSMDVSRLVVNPTTEEIASMMAVNLNCGMLPYAELPNFFGLKLGLTGSLQSASEREKDILKVNYNFSVFSIMPSIFNKEPPKLEKPEVLAGDLEAEYYEKIREDIQSKVNAGRAVLVVFQNLDRLDRFRQWLEQNPYAQEPDLGVLTGDESLEKKEELIAMAARSRKVTLINRPFGRGSDFVCRDSALRNAGGLHVIQTFACDLKSEEVQIRGRTCRQDNPGSYRQVLFLDDLKPFGIHGEAGRSDFLAQQASNQDLTWTGFIDQKREDVLLRQRFQKIDNSRLASEERFRETQAFIQAATGGQWEDATDLLIKFNAGAGGPKGKHTLPRAIIFVVDRTEESILDPCIDSVKFIVETILSDADKIGLYGLGEGWIIPPSSKGDIASTFSDMLASAKKVSGRCMLYRSMLHAVRMLNSFADHHRWLVVLTDTVDLEDLFGGHEWESGKKALALHPSKNAFLAGTIADAADSALLGINFEEDGSSQQVQKESVQPMAETEDAMQGVAMDPAMVQKLMLAGARKGTLRVALDWASTDDLDLHLMTPAGEICYQQKQCGGGELDVDQNVEHDKAEAVENIYFDELPRGSYEARVELFNRGGHHSKDPVDFKVWFTTQFRVHVSGPAMQPKTVSGTTTKFETQVSESDQIVHVFSFTFDGPTDGLSDATAGHLYSILRETSNMSMAIVDCSNQSAWNRQSPKWFSFAKNIQECLTSAKEGKNNDVYHLQGGDTQRILECFKEIASLLVIPGTAKPKPRPVPTPKLLKEPTHPVDIEQPTDPATPTALEEPLRRPAKRRRMGEQPGQSNPAVPAAPAAPTAPTDLGGPEKPNNPDSPGDADGLNTPDKPDTPNGPGGLRRPGGPGGPDAPDGPVAKRTKTVNDE